MEHYWAAHWISLKDKFERSRETLLQVEIHEGVTSAMHQYTANLEPFNQQILTTEDLSFLVESFDKVAASLEAPREMTGVDVPIPKSDEIRRIIKISLMGMFPREADSILKGTKDGKLTLDQILVAGELVDMVNRWVKANQMYQAVYSLYDTTLSRLQRNAQNAEEIPGGESFAKRFASLRDEIAMSRERFYKTGVLLESGSNFVDEANALRMEFGTFLRVRSKELVEQETRYKGWSRTMYLVGSIFLLVGIALPKKRQSR